MAPRKRQTSGTDPRNRKIARVWCLARDLGMDTESLHLAVESVTGKNSISVLGMMELDIVANKLKELLRRQNREKYLENARSRKNGTAFMSTPAQKNLVSDYIEKLTPVLQLNKPDFYLESICRRTFRKDYKKLNKGEMQRLIEVLKSIHKRHQEEK